MASYTINDHVQSYDSNNDSDDTKSNSSSVSSARIAETCPCCKKEIQARVMFNHIRKLHPDYLKSMYGVWKDDQLNELIKYNAPFPIEWTMKDDFDEDVNKTLWGCLGCNNTFTTEHNATKHCLGKCKKDHNANLRRIKKEEQQDKEKRDKKMSEGRLKWLNRTPIQILSCIQQDVDFYNKKWTEVSQKVVRYLCVMNYENQKDFIFLPMMNPIFEDDKKKMEQKELESDREIIKWKRLYEDILPLFWGATHIISHSTYEEIEKKIIIGKPEYTF